MYCNFFLIYTLFYENLFVRTLRLRVTKNMLRTYRIFSIKRPRRSFQNWPCGPGVNLKPAFNRGPAFIYEMQFSESLRIIITKR